MTTKNKTRGLLYYAHNNEVINYLKLAICSALTARHHLNNFRATIITDKYSLESLNEQDNQLLSELFEYIKIDDTIFNHKNYRVVMHVYENKGRQPWYNRTRPNAYKDSIYDETVLIDVDFIFQDNFLDSVWNSENSVMLSKKTIPLVTRATAKKTNLPEEEMVSNFTIPLHWATIVYFKRDQFAKEYFDKINQIHENYLYYRTLYQIDESEYRNDYAFSIALHLMNGCVIPGPEYELPSKFIITSTMDHIYRIDKSSTKFILHTRTWPAPWHLFNLKQISYHCLNKVSLLMKYEQFLDVYADIKQDETITESTSTNKLQNLLNKIIKYYKKMVNK